mgnify:CR=1 FL=1
MAGQGTTSYSSGIVRTYYSELPSVQLSLEGSYYFRKWEEFIGVEDEHGLAKLREVPTMILQR